MGYENALRKAEKTGRMQEDCEDIADYMVQYDLTAKEAEKMLVSEGVLTPPEK
jgi:type II secretory pathway component PulF